VDVARVHRHDDVHHGVRRVVVVASRPFPAIAEAGAEWFDEARFPFTRADVDAALGGPRSRNGWYLQQLLKLYAPFVVPGLADHVLIVDADARLLSPVAFVDPASRRALYHTGTEHHAPYFAHMARLDPAFVRAHPGSGIAHHQLMERQLLAHVMARAEAAGGFAEPFWRRFLLQVDVGMREFSGASEYELYFHHAVAHWGHRVAVRQLRAQLFSDTGYPREGAPTELQLVVAHAVHIDRSMT
jgi:hypothetical protein